MPWPTNVLSSVAATDKRKVSRNLDRQVQSLSAVDGDENESDSEANSDLDSFAGDLENLLDAEEWKGMRAEEEIEDEAAEAAELCRLLMDDEEAAEQKKKKKTKTTGIEAGLVFGSKSNFIDNAERIKKTKKVHPNGSYITKENSNRDFKEVETLFGKRKMSDKVKAMKNNATSDSSTPRLKAKVKILGEGLKIFKEKKSSRESFVCGACGQLGHMRTNKNCPKYGEEPDTQVEITEIEKASAKSSSLDPSSKSQQKLQKKKSMTESTTKIEAPEGEKSSLKSKVLPVKFKCGSTEKFSDKPADGAAQSSDLPITSDARPDSSDLETVSKPISKVNKIIISNKAKPDDVQVESHKPSIVIRPPLDTDRGQIEPHKPSIVIRPPINAERNHIESHKPSIVIRPPAAKDRDQGHKKIVIKQPKEIIDVDQGSQDGSTGFEYRKIKKIAELSGWLGNILERVVDTLKDRLDVSYLFLKPVSKKEAPDYLDIIKRPMDLSTIREKVRKMEYKHREEFRHDMWQITYNAHLYNDGRNPGIPPLADQLLELCDYLLKEHNYSLSEAEAGIESREH
ncbi:hypothetical protein GH714_008082 [Hevea brasiliensis]|uniref:Bromo domain-containing protein n=1 Tax=Hevea brasiliensis TaxID=3981 RepID=A0A6A6L085_HEVBR|nr:hypothetical protein GH714_008082 [Hevea brasiliensis]